MSCIAVFVEHVRTAFRKVCARLQARYLHGAQSCSIGTPITNVMTTVVCSVYKNGGLEIWYTDKWAVEWENGQRVWWGTREELQQRRNI